jgi:hypothetical protein
LVLSFSHFVRCSILGNSLRCVLHFPHLVSENKLLEFYGLQMSREIEDLCEKNSRVFLDALEEVLRVKQGARKLKEQVLAIQADVSSAGQNLKDAVAQLNAVRRARANVEVARATLLTCCDVLATCKRIQDYLTNGKYAASLRLMEELENSGLLVSVQQFELGQYVTRRLPQLKDRIRREVAAQLSGWLQSAREAAGRVGRAALVSSLAEEEVGEGIWIEALAGLWAGLEGWVAPRNAASFHELVEGAGGLALAPPHRSLYIYSRLGAEQDFRELYLEARRATVRGSMGSRETPLESLCRAVGFFVIEDAVGLRLLDESAIHSLWDVSLGHVTDALGHASDGPHLTSLAMQTLLSERVAGALYLPLDRLQAAARHLAKRHVCWGAQEAGREALSVLLAARYSAPLSEKDFERLAGKHPGLAVASSGPGAFTVGAVEALEGLQSWKSKAAAWLEAGFGGDEEAVNEGTVQWAATLGKGLAEHAEANVGALVQLLVDAQVVAEVSQGSSAALAEELANVWQPQLCLALLEKLRGLVGTVQQQSMLSDVWPYLDAVLPKHLPAKLLAPLRVAAVRSTALLVRETVLAEANITPTMVALLLRDAAQLRSWSFTAEPDDLLLLFQLGNLLSAGPAMSSFLDSAVRSQRWSLLWSKLPRDELVMWLSRLREEGSSFFGGAKVDKNAESLAKKIGLLKK